ETPICAGDNGTAVRGTPMRAPSAAGPAAGAPEAARAGERPCCARGCQRVNSGCSLQLFSYFPLTCLPRYEEATNELINEELGIAYPIIDGIPNMIPEAARMIQKKPPAEDLKQA
uniref:Protein preY, mitochondrial n=1 Tax=Amazona collaria TaxID=241587 RepID=A0A8B9F9I1_9PSIT